jgi:acetoacetyl-CoA reductase
LVTGASQGIGRACALALAEQGATVALCARNEAKLGEVAAEINEPTHRGEAAMNGAPGLSVGRAHAFALDLSSEESIKACAKAVIEQLGKVEILVNNAGITRDGTLMKMSRDMWDAVIDTNLGSCYNLCKLTFESMRSAKFGRIVNIGSINGQAGQYGQVNYAAAKSGIHGFTKALAQEGARFGITVNAIAPGYVDTEMVRAVPPDVLEKIVARIPVGRLGRPCDIARGVVFLTDDASDFVTGSTLSINGGQHMY